VPWATFQFPIDNKIARRNLREYLLMGCPKVKTDGQIVITSVNGYNLARTILSKDFIAPEEIAIARKLIYSDKVLRHFAETLPSKEALQWLRDNGFTLIAGTPSPLSLLEIRRINPRLFYSKSGGWYAEEKQKFSRNDKVTAEWLMLRKSIVPNSTKMIWGGQQKLLTKVEYVPNVAEAAWGETTYKEVRGAWLFPNIYARTSSVFSNGCCVSFGDSSLDGVHVSNYWDDVRDDNLGLASARKRNL